jgi:ribosomal protein S18 acetylase RimI-like enzyme
MIIRQAELDDIPAINHLAHETWWPTYTDVIPDEQIKFMLENMYSEESLKLQIESGITFLIAERENKPVGFAAWSLSEAENHVCKLQKLYVLPSEQGQGTGKKLLDEVSKIAKQSNGKVLELNVNRNNPSFAFYNKMGFEVFKLVDIPYGPFMMNDYVMRKEL